jgi:hypothetical protein
MESNAHEPPEKSDFADAYAEAVEPEIKLLKEERRKQEERERQKAEAEGHLQEAMKAGDAAAETQAREEIQDLEDQLLISEGKIDFGDESPPSPPSP